MENKENTETIILMFIQLRVNVIQTIKGTGRKYNQL